MSALTGARHSRAWAEINVTPLVDVMLVLVIIFMIAAPLVMHRVDISVGKGREAKDGPQVALAIDAAGEVRWDGVPMSAPMLDAQFAFAARQDPQPILVVHADDAVRYERVASVLAAADQAGITGLTFAER